MKRYEKAKEYTQKYKNVLAPCKYCGNTDIYITSDRAFWGSNKGKNLWSVVCSTPNCDCTKPFSSVRAAITHWNDRHQKSTQYISKKIKERKNFYGKTDEKFIRSV